MPLAGTRRPGTYQLWFVYRDCGLRIDSTDGAPEVVIGQFASNAITVEVR